MKPADAQMHRGPLWLVYLMPVGTTIAATLLRLAIAPLTGSAVPFVTYFAAAILLAWYCGFWPAALSILLGIFAGSHYVLNAGSASFSPWGPSQHAAVIGFSLTALAVSFLIDFQRRILERAKAAEKAQAAVAEENARLLQQAQRAQDDLKRSNEELQRANRDLEDFAYSASHDLQEPVRTIALSAQLIAQTWNGNAHENGAAFLLQIQSSAKRMQSLIADLLEYARAAAQDNSPPPSVDSGLVLAGVLENLHGSIQESRATITADQPLPAVAIHESRLAQVFQNLLSNAIKYRNAEPPRIHVGVKPQGDGWIFSVVDNGIGIPSNYAEQIFGLFKRLHDQETYLEAELGWRCANG